MTDNIANTTPKSMFADMNEKIVSPILITAKIIKLMRNRFCFFSFSC